MTQSAKISMLGVLCSCKFSHIRHLSCLTSSNKQDVAFFGFQQTFLEDLTAELLFLFPFFSRPSEEGICKGEDNGSVNHCVMTLASVGGVAWQYDRTLRRER